MVKEIYNSNINNISRKMQSSFTSNSAHTLRSMNNLANRNLWLKIIVVLLSVKTTSMTKTIN